jgi:hypothetical protein
MVNKFLPVPDRSFQHRPRKEREMVSSGEPKFSGTLSGRELEAQQLACSYLLKGCERALFQFGLVAGETGNVDASSVDERAADIMRDILGSWRETLSLLEASAPAGKRGRSPQGWTFMQTPGAADSAGESTFD